MRSKLVLIAWLPFGVASAQWLPPVVPRPGSPVIGAGAPLPPEVCNLMTRDVLGNKFNCARPTIGAIQTIAAVTGIKGPVSINAGDGAFTPFVQDNGFDVGNTTTNNLMGPVDITIPVPAVCKLAPTDVYRSERYGTFNYTITGLTPGKTYQVCLHFSEDYPGDNATGRRVFDVNVNGVAMLSVFDIFAIAGTLNRIVIEGGQYVADITGNITIAFVPNVVCVHRNGHGEGV